jgi:FKBP-type peptidyl-prolyl cis-trans isomerase FkpA
MRKLGFFLIPVALLAAQGASAQALKTDDDKTLYALGLVIGGNLGAFALSPAELDIVKKGITDSVKGTKPAVEIDTFGPKIQALQQARATVRAEKEKKKGADYQTKIAKESGVEKLPSGLLFKTLTAGKGEQPKTTDMVKVHYEGTLVDGTVFDSSKKRGTPAEFNLGQVIKCWTEGVGKMHVGEKARLVCPPEIAYGPRGAGGKIPGNATLTFEVELLEVKPAPPPSPTPGPGPGGMPGALPPGGPGKSPHD